MRITFHSYIKTFKLNKKSHLKKWIQTIIEKNKKVPGNIFYSFVSDEEILKTNIQFLKHNTYTDIITFNYNDRKVINSEIFISIERVRENAKILNENFEDELHRVMIHGILHLLGYSDKTKKEKELIRKKENEYLKLL